MVVARSWESSCGGLSSRDHSASSHCQSPLGKLRQMYNCRQQQSCFGFVEPRQCSVAQLYVVHLYVKKRIYMYTQNNIYTQVSTALPYPLQGEIFCFVVALKKNGIFKFLVL